MEQGKKQLKVQVKANDAVMSGTYANNCIVHMNREEFVLDFVNLVPPHATLNARVIVTPANIKRISHILTETLKKYESEFGSLPEVAFSPPDAEIIQ